MAYKSIEEKLDAKYLKKKKEGEDKTSSSSSQGTTSKTSTATVKKNYGSVESRLDKKYGSTEANASSVSGWFERATKLATNFKAGDTSKYTKNYGSAYTSEINKLKDSSEDVWKYLTSHKNDFDKETYDGLTKSWGELTNYLTSVGSHIDDVNKHYSQWKDEDTYNADMMDWLEEDYKSTPEKVKARRDRFKSNTDRVEQIKEEIKALEVKRSEAFSDPNTSMDVVATYDDKIAALEDERDKLKVENRKYERHHKTDSYFDVTQNEDFADVSAKREFTNPAEAELDKYDSDLYNAERWYADNAVYGATKDENGNVYDAKGNLKFSVTPASVEDKLGLFLSASEDDVARASNELANNTDVNNTWASTLDEGRANDWSQLKEGEIGIYYYLLNTKGQEEAYKYLDDMTVELNRRAASEMEKEISGASLLEKLAYNVASVPANIIGGVPALIDNVSHIVQGEEINPYSKANSLMNFASASRGALAEEINERTGNASLPYIGTTWGDAYQAVMSGADSWVGAATFGPSYLALMSSNAAASKMKEMYESGATTSQMVIGGGVAGAAEYLFEKLPLEGMLKILKGKDLKGGRAIASAWLKQSATEAFEEMGTEATNILADALVLGSQSDLAGYVDKYIANGDSKGLAIWKALAYDAAPEVINAGIGGLISGGGIGGVASVASYANYQAETTNHGREILEEKGVPALKALADEVSGVTEGRLSKNIGKLSSKVSATALEGKNKLSTAIKNRNNANAIGRLSNMVEDARISLNTADVVSALEEKGLSSKEAKKGAETIISRANGEDVELDNLKVAEVYNELVGEGKSQLKQTITERNIHHGATRLGIDAKNRTVDGKSIEKEVDTEGKVAESGKTTRISTGEAVTIDKDNAIAKIKVVDGVEKVFFNTDKGVVEATDIQYKNESEALIYESFTDLHPSIATAAIKAYDGKISAQKYIKGMREGILLYGKHNFQAVGKDISVFSDLAQLSEADQALALKLGKAVSNIETSKADKALKSAIKSATERAEKDTAEGKKIEKRGKVSFSEGAKVKGQSQKRAVKLARVLANVIGIDIVFYDSMTTTDKELKKSNGGYVDGTIYLDLQHSSNDAHTIAFTMSHELVHFVKEYSEAKFKVFADFLMEEYAKHGVSTSTLLANKMAELEENDPDKAFEEMIADACERMLLDSNVMLKLAKLKQIDLDLFEKIRLHILDILNKIRAEYARMNYAPTSQEAKELLKMEDVIEQLYEKFEDMVVDATENFQTIGTKNLNDYADAKTTDGKTLFQYKAIMADEKSYRVMLQEHTDMTNAEINSLFQTVDKAVDIIKDNLEILDYAWEEDIDDRAFNPVKQNSDPLYKFSVDFSTMCRKRILQQVIIEELQSALDRAVTKAESIAIRNELMKLQEQGRQIEIACALCYVESARMKSPAQIQKFLNDKGDVVRRYLATKSAGEIKEKIAKAEADTRKKLAKQYADEIAKGEMPDPTEMVGKKTKRFISLKSLPQKVAEEIRVAKREVVDGYKPNANEAKIIKTAESLSVEDFTSAKGLENLAKNHPEIFDAYTSYIRNATKSKGTEKDVWWRIGDSQKLTDDLIATMNAENGLRTQSWSDFQVMHLLDYVGAIIELSARKAKMQAYTKVPDYVHLMGNTNQMINLSLIPMAEFNGKLDFDSVEGMAFKMALTLRDRYPSTAGTISIGINNEQIRLLLESALIDYVIPYHQSGMSKVVRKQMHIPTWESYESHQNEKSLKGEDAKKNAKAYGVKLLSNKDPMWHKAPKFSEWFDIEEARQIAEMENHTPSDPASQEKYGVMYGAYKAMQNAADNYLKLCAERGLSPKFSHESADFTKEENYWKLLIDRKMINNVTGEIIEQKPVQAVFDEAEVLRILNDEVARYPKVKEDQDYATRTVVSKFLSGEMNEDTAKIAASILEKPVDNITKVSILNSADDITPSKKLKKQAKRVEKDDGTVYNVSNEKHSPIAWVLNNDLLTPTEIKKFNSALADIKKHGDVPWMKLDRGSFVIDVGAKLVLTEGTMVKPHILDIMSYTGDDRFQFEIIKESIKDVINFRPNKQRSKSALEAAFDTYVSCYPEEFARHYFRDFTTVQGYDFYGEGVLQRNDDRVDSQGLAEEGNTSSNTDDSGKSQGKKVKFQKKTSAKTPLETILKNLEVYTYAQLQSINEQMYEGHFEGYNDYSRDDLEQILREALGIVARELSPEERGESNYGFYVPPVEDKIVKANESPSKDKKAELTHKIGISDLINAFEEELLEYQRVTGEDKQYKDFISWVKAKGSDYVAEEILTTWGTELSATDTMQNLIDAKWHSAKELSPETEDLELHKYVKNLVEKFVNGDIKDSDLQYTLPVDNANDDSHDFFLDNDFRFQKKRPSNRVLLSNALESTIDDSTIEGKLQSNVIERYKESIAKVEELEAHLAEVKKEIYELSFKKGSRDMARLRELREDKMMTENRINTFDRRLLEIESTKPMKDLLQREKEMVRKRYEEEGRAKVKTAIARKNESLAVKKERENLQKLILSTAKWLESPGKNDVKCPDILRKPFANFLASIDTSSKSLLKQGKATRNDYKFAMAMDSLATAIDRIKSAQDPNAKTDGENASVELGGYLDLPENFAENIRIQAEGIKSFMDMASNGDSIINDMSADELKELSKIIKILKKGITDMQTLYTNYRFANAQALGRNTMEYADSLGEAKDSTKLKDFAVWDNTVPYYAFRRFGEGGESIFESLMDSQDKLAFLADEILKFKEKNWTDKEVSAWSKDTHTIDLPSGRKISLTTADAMSIYCLSRRFQGKQHLIAGGVRVVGLTEKGKKLPDVKANLASIDVDAIADSLTDRQKKVAQKMQEFMSTRCAEWGNEIWMKRFLTTMFNEKNYFPIESDPNVMDYKDPARHQSDLFRLLNISATKPLTEGANNRVVIRNIFDVFSAHSSDMARLNAYGMSLLDYMKWLNYREKAVNKDNGEIQVTGVRNSLDTAYGSAAMKYVVNLIKDINGSGDIAKDNSFAMQMMRGSKTAAVGANLRVALLQFTSLPRASLVLDPRSIALGLGKKPSIEKAKKYCGMALWKSFGFYDTNIGKSIESQIKGDRTVTDKMIELSLKGAELGDSITWGYLWNACEYEVAKTKKYKVGTEEFNQAVAKKLREVIYASQVVDSTLTRSQMMRSKSGLNQMLSAFMSEPTLTYNIQLDALSQFNNEKRRTKSAKLAWQATKGVVTRSISTIMVTSIIVSLAETLADAFRDDDDEPFGEKFIDGLWKSFVSNINPLNKIPVASDIVGWIEAKLGIGYFSSDRLDTQYLTTLSNAYDAWVDIIKNGKDADKTIYYAIYNTTKATSQITGLPISNAVREVATLWNNTAGAFDKTLKLRSYDLSNEKLGNELYEAIVKGKDRQAESLKNQFEDEKSMNNALVKAIRENNADVIDVVSDYINGDVSAYDSMVKKLVAQGFSEEVASKAIKSVKSMVESAAQYEANGDTDAYNEKVADLVALGYDKDQLLEDIDMLEKSPQEDKATSIYTKDDYVTSVLSGNTTLASTIKEDLIDTMVENGKTEEEAENSLSNALNTRYKTEYAEGRMSDSEVTSWVRERSDPDDTEADIHWAVKEWKARAENMDVEDYSYSKYAEFHQAILDGDTRTMNAFIKECREYNNGKTNKEVASDIASAITSHFKPIYKEASPAERVSLKAKLLNAYGQLGYARSNRSKLIDKWLED